MQTLRIAHAASRRALASEFLRLGGRALGVGSAAALALVAADKLAGGVAPWPLLVALPLGISAVAAAVWAVLRRWNPLRAAIELDRALGLKDRLSSALEFDAQGKSDPFAQIAVRDAEAAARGVKLNQVIPLRPDWTWIAWPLAGAAAVAAAIWAPHVVWPEPTADERAPIATAAEAAAEVAAATEVAQTVVESTVEDLASPEELQTLRELHEQLVGGRSDPDEARTKAAGEIEQLAGKLERQAREEQLRQDALRERLAQLAKDEGGQGRSSPLADALERGDLAAARDAVRALMNGADQLTPEQRAQAARELERLAARKPPAAPDASPGASPTGGVDGAQPPSPSEGGPQDPPQNGTIGEPLRQELADQGLTPEQIEQIARSTDPAEIAESLKRSGVDPAAAERLGQRAAQENQRRQSREQAQRQVDELRDAMRQAADDLREPPRDGTDPQRPNNAPQGEQQDQATGRGERRPEQPELQEAQEQEGEGTQERQGEQRQPGDASAPQGQPQPQGPDSQQQSRQGEQPSKQQQQPGQQSSQQQDQPQGQQQGPQEGDQPGEGPGEQPGQHPRPTPGADVPAPTPQAQPGGEGREQGTEPRQGTQPGETPGGEQSQPGQGRQPGGDREGQQPATGPGEQGQEGQPGSRPSAREGQGGQRGSGGAESQNGRGSGIGRGSGLRMLQQQLERMAGEADNARQQEQQAQRLRQMAQDLLEKSTPEEREELRKWAEKLQQEQAARRAASGTPWSGATEDVDARRPPEGQRPADERIVAQWFGGAPAERDDAVSRRPVGEQIRQAVRSAERAVEGQDIAPRHRELIRRVFRRYSQRSETPAPPADSAGNGGR